jgi:N utilization substance protein B
MNARDRSSSAWARIRSRRNAVQALYQWDMTRRPVDEVVSEFEAERPELKKADHEYFRRLVGGVAEHHVRLETELSGHLDREPAALDPVERAILLLGMYELIYCPDVPWRVIVNESIDLARMFGAEQSYRYINGVLDAAAHRLRAAGADVPG